MYVPSLDWLRKRLEEDDRMGVAALLISYRIEDRLISINRLHRFLVSV
jgi:hypothetical protein